MQIYSHHRFVENWDKVCIDMIKDLQKIGHQKPLLTAYIPSYDPSNDPDGRATAPWKMNFDRFIPEGAVFFLPSAFDDFDAKDRPLAARYYSAHFCFTLGEFSKEVQHDPNYYFHVEEISIAARAFTKGYDLFHPHKIIAWHEYTRKHRTKQWDYNKEWIKANEASHLRNRKLFEMDGELRDIDFGEYGFGEEKTLLEYEKYAGMCFRKRGVTKDTILHKEPKLYRTNQNTVKFYQSLQVPFKYCINVYKKSLTHNPDEYNFWAVILEDKNGKQLFRKDATKEEIKNLMSKEGDFIDLWREFFIYDNNQPAKWIVWPNTSEGWQNKIEGRI